MKLFLVGGTGRTGRWILESALNRGHQVTALVREPIGRLGVSHASLKVMPGDLMQTEDLVQALSGQDAIISALNSGVVRLGTEKLIQVAQSAGVERFLGIAGGGILQLDEERLRRERPGYPSLFFKSSGEHLQAWRMLEASALNWTLLCTPDLSNKPATGQAKSRADYMPEGGNSVALGDVAEFIMDELEAKRFLRKRVGFTV